MGSILFVTITLFSLLPGSAAAGGVFVAGGEGFYFSHNTELLIGGYQFAAPVLFNEESFYEVSYSAWTGRNQNLALNLARGLRWERNENDSVSLTAGFSRIDGTTANLGQPYEFYGCLVYEKRLGGVLFSLGWIHYSDAKFLFHWPGPNTGENFVILSLGGSY